MFILFADAIHHLSLQQSTS